MRAAALPPPHQVRTQHDTLPSFGIALGMHALLFLAISYVVHWNTQDPAPVVAELWVASPTPTPVVQTPTPPPPPPPPPKVETPPEPPKPADIVTQEEKKPPPKKEEPPKVEEKKAPPPPPPPPPKKVEPKKVEPKKDPIADLMKKQDAESRAEREAVRQAENERIAQQMAQVGTPQTGTGSSRNTDYINRLTALIKSRIVYAVPEGTSTSVYAEVQVDLLPSGEIAGIKFLKPSELPEYDAAVERAIRRTDPFPRKPDGTVDRTITIRFRPVEPQN